MTDFTQIPFDRIIRFGQATMLNDDLFSVSWILGRFCNYKCSYCWPYANSQTPDHQEYSVYTNTIDEIKKQARQNGFYKFHWSFSGGEPTAYKHLNKLIAYLGQEDYQSIHMTTNLSPGINWWTTWLENTKYMQRRSITASYHAEFANEDNFIETCKFLQSNHVLVTVNQVMVPEQFEELYARCKRMNDQGINVTLKPQSDSNASQVVDGYTEEQFRIMQTGFHQTVNEAEILQVKLIDDTNKEWHIDQAERFNSFGFNKFKGWTCNSGYQSVIIRENEVKRSYSCHDQILGTLNKGFKLFDTPKVCITSTCVSSADSKIPKCK